MLLGYPSRITRCKFHLSQKMKRWVAENNQLPTYSGLCDDRHTVKHLIFLKERKPSTQKMPSYCHQTPTHNGTVRIQSPKA